MIQYFRNLVRRGLLGANPPLEETAPNDKNIDPLFIELRAKCKRQAASQVAREFTSYKAVQQECKKRKLGARGKLLDLKEKLILCIAEDKYKSEIAQLEARLKKYKPEVDPEYQHEWNELYQVLRDHENFVDV